MLSLYGARGMQIALLFELWRWTLIHAASPLLYRTVEGYGVGFPLLVFSVPASGRVR